MKIKRICGHTFVINLLNNPAIIFDCGVNHGDFSNWIIENINAKIFGFEPDPRLYSRLEHKNNVHYYPYAVTSHGKPAILYLGINKDSSIKFIENNDQNKIIIPSIRLDNFYIKNNIKYIDLLKMDVEGSEIEILLKLNKSFLENVGQITVEFHDFIQKGDIPQIKQIIKLLKNYGFFYIRMSFHDFSDVLFINKNEHNIRTFTFFYLKLYKYISGIKRFLKNRI